MLRQGMDDMTSYPLPLPEVVVERQNSVKMEVFRLWTLHYFEIFYLFFHSALHHDALRCTIDDVAKIKPEVGTKIASKWRFFVPGASKCRF